jgi:hypothetical protein
MIKLKFLRFDSGFCRAYYHNQENRALYCLQYGVRESEPVGCLICTDDGEPSYQVPHDNKSFERPTNNDGEKASVRLIVKSLKIT